MSIVKGARNLDNAKKWYDWALTAPAQNSGAATRNYQVPANKSAKVPPAVTKLTEIKLIDFDFGKVWLVVRAPPVAGQMGQRGKRTCRNDCDVGAPHHRGRGMSRTAKMWLALDGPGSPSFPGTCSAGLAGMACGLLTDGPRSAASLALTGVWWLGPVVLPCCATMSPGARGARSSKALVAAGSQHRAHPMQGLAIGLNGWS